MIFPDKLLNYQESILPKSVQLLNCLKDGPIGVSKLYEQVKKHYDDLDTYILTLEFLYVLDKIEYDEEWEVVKYVENDKM